MASPPDPILSWLNLHMEDDLGIYYEACPTMNSVKLKMRKGNKVVSRIIDLSDWLIDPYLLLRTSATLEKMYRELTASKGGQPE